LNKDLRKRLEELSASLLRLQGTINHLVADAYRDGLEKGKEEAAYDDDGK
jgi:hypothetical protein